MINNERNDMEITTDTYGIEMRDYQDTLVTRLVNMWRTELSR